MEGLSISGTRKWTEESELLACSEGISNRNKGYREVARCYAYPLLYVQLKVSNYGLIS